MSLRVLLVTIVSGLLLSACASGGARVGGGNDGVRGSVSGTIFKF